MNNSPLVIRPRNRRKRSRLAVFVDVLCTLGGAFLALRDALGFMLWIAIIAGATLGTIAFMVETLRGAML